MIADEVSLHQRDADSSIVETKTSHAGILERKTISKVVLRTREEMPIRQFIRQLLLDAGITFLVRAHIDNGTQPVIQPTSLPIPAHVAASALAAGSTGCRISKAIYIYFNLDI